MSDHNPDSRKPPKNAVSRIRLPGFLVENDIGIGDVIKRTTYAVGIRPCSGCEQRAKILNRWVSFGRGPR
jgi:hypothetical protein